MDLGLHTTLSDANSKLDPEVIAVAKQVSPNLSDAFGKVWDLFSVRQAPFETDKFQVLARTFTQPEVVVQASGSGADWDTNSDITALPVSSGTIDRITIGDVLQVESEIVVVKSVDRSGNTIDVYERGAGESAAAAHGTAAITALVIGHSAREGRVDVESLSETTEVIDNYCQLVEESIDLSFADSEQARKTGRTEDTLKAEAMTRVMRKLARTAIYGVARENTSTIPALTRGLLGWLTYSGAITTNVGGAFTEDALLDILQDVRIKGGTINAIVMSVENKKVFNMFDGAGITSVMRDAEKRMAGRIVDVYLADGFGEIPVIVDLDMPNDKVAVVNTNKLSKGWKMNDELRFVDEGNVSSREKKQTLQGKFGLAVEGVGTTHGVLTGLTTGQSGS